MDDKGKYFYCYSMNEVKLKKIEAEFGKQDSAKVGDIFKAEGHSFNRSFRWGNWREATLEEIKNGKEIFFTKTN